MTRPAPVPKAKATPPKSTALPRVKLTYDANPQLAATAASRARLKTEQNDVPPRDLFKRMDSSSFWAAKSTTETTPTKVIDVDEEKKKADAKLKAKVVTILGDTSEELTEEEDEDDDDGIEEGGDGDGNETDIPLVQVVKVKSEAEDVELAEAEADSGKPCQNCARDEKSCELAPRVGRYPRCKRCIDKDWRCSFIPVKNGVYQESEPARHTSGRAKLHITISDTEDIKPPRPKVPAPPRVPRTVVPVPPKKDRAKFYNPYSRPPVSPHGKSNRDKDKDYQTPQSSSSNGVRFRGGGASSRSAPNTPASRHTASSLGRRLSHNARVLEHTSASNPPSPLVTQPHRRDTADETQLLDALSKMSRALRLSSEAFQLLAEYQRGGTARGSGNRTVASGSASANASPSKGKGKGKALMDVDE